MSQCKLNSVIHDVIAFTDQYGALTALDGGATPTFKLYRATGSGAFADSGVTVTSSAGATGEWFVYATVNSGWSEGDSLVFRAYGTLTTDGTARTITQYGKDIFAVVSVLPSDIYALVDTEVAAIKAKTDNLPSDPADASDIAAAFASVASTLSTIAGYIDTEVAAIKAKTDGLPSDPADASDIAASFSSIASTLTSLSAAITDLQTHGDDNWAGGGADALDAVIIETDIVASASLVDDDDTQLTEINARQALSLITSTLVGILAARWRRHHHHRRGRQISHHARHGYFRYRQQPHPDRIEGARMTYCAPGYFAPGYFAPGYFAGSSSATSESVHWNCLLFAQDRIRRMDLPGIADSSVVIKKTVLERFLGTNKQAGLGVPLPAVVLFPVPETANPAAGLTGLDDVVYGVGCLTVALDNAEPTAELGLQTHMLWRQRLHRAFRNQSYPDDLSTVIKVEVSPRTLYDPSAYFANFAVSYLLLLFTSREPRGLNA